MELTSKQTLELAKSFSNMAALVLDYSLDTWERTTEDQQVQLAKLFQQLIDYSNLYINLSGTLLFKDAQSDLQSLDEIVNEMNDTLKKLEDVQLVIHIIGTVLDLGAAIASKDPALIVSKIQSVFLELKRE